MTFSELENMLPNGFHDSALYRWTVDYVRGTLRMDMSLCVGDPDGPREHWDDVRDARVDISGLIFFAIEPPDQGSDYCSALRSELCIVDTHETRDLRPRSKIVDKKLLAAIPADAFVYSFFVRDWNAFIHIAAKDCSMDWLGEPQNYQGSRQHFVSGDSVHL